MMVVNNRWFETGMPPSRGVMWRTGWPCLRRGWRIKLKTMSRLQLSVERQEFPTAVAMPLIRPLWTDGTTMD